MIKLILSTTLIISTTTLWASKVENFSHRSELAIVSTGGNSKVETYNAKTESTYEVGKRSYTAGGHYTLGLQGAEDGDMQESARNWDAKVKYEQALRRNFNATAAIQFEGDEFSGYEQRENHDLGGKYIFVDTDKKSLYFEAAYRYTEEVRTQPNDKGRDIFYFSKATLTTEFRRKPGRTFSYSFWLQYVPNFTEPDDYQINFEPSFSVMINEMFSMKVAYKANYDNSPNVEGNEYTDYQYTTALVAEF